jgi:hypothetical protein
MTRRRFLERTVQLGAGVTLTGGGLPLTAAVQQPSRLPFENRVGWAYSAIPGVSQQEMVADLTRMKALGMNTVYIAHNNPGDAYAEKFEPGLSYAVYFALKEHTPSEASAYRLLEAVRFALEAAKAVGIDVVLPIAYQIQMGPEWDERYPQELRTDPDGEPMNHWASGETASPYSERYRTDISEFYRWANTQLVQRYPNIVAVGLASEPMGSDFSPSARREFVRRYGVPLDEALAADRGAFLSGVLADHAAWSASYWRELKPRVYTMMDFHIQRDAPFFPDMEQIFAQTPDNFIFSEDTHLFDLPAETPTPPSEINLLYGMVRTLGWLSRVYAKPLLLWTAANDWGLSDVGPPLEEALLNLDIVANTPRMVGGHLGMIMAWGWNIRYQGVYRDEGFFTRVDKEQFIGRISQELANRRSTLAAVGNAPPSVVLYLPSEVLHRRVGEQYTSHLLEPFEELTRFDFIGNQAVWLTDGRALDMARAAGSRIVTIGTAEARSALSAVS